MMWFDAFSSPIGTLTVAADSDALCHVLFANHTSAIAGRDHWRRDASAVRTAREQLLAYFAGERVTFDLALRPSGTPFQERVWNALAEIPFGVTWSYAELARHIGAPKAVRAVGGANAHNPLPIVLPCHRVIGSDGSLTGFGGGVPVKRFLLELERSAGATGETSVHARTATPSQQDRISSLPRQDTAPMAAKTSPDFVEIRRGSDIGTREPRCTI